MMPVGLRHHYSRSKFHVDNVVLGLLARLAMCECNLLAHQSAPY